MLDLEIMLKKPKDGNKFIYRYFDEDGSYIGQTKKSLKARAGKDGRLYCKDDNKWSQAILEKGFNHFSVEILCECLEAEADIKEKEFIKQFDSRAHGYNSTPGGLYYNPDFMQKSYKNYLTVDKINEVLNGPELDDFLYWYSSLSEQQFDKYFPDSMSFEAFEFITSAIDHKIYERKYTRIYTDSGLTAKEIKKALKTRTIDLPLPIGCEAYNKIFEGYKQVNSKYAFTDNTDIAEECYSEDDYALYRNIKDNKKFIIFHRNYMPGCGTDYWATICD